MNPERQKLLLHDLQEIDKHRRALNSRSPISFITSTYPMTTLTRQQRRSCFYRNWTPAVSKLQTALAACDVIDKAHSREGERPKATARFRLLSRDVHKHRPACPFSGKNHNQRQALHAGFTASRCKVFTKLPERLL